MSAVVGRMGRLCTCQVAQCLCCSLRAGIITMSALMFINACFAFAGEAALLGGMLSAVSEQAAGQYLPAGTRLDPGNKAVHGGLIFLGLYALLISIFGTVAAVRRRVWAATAFLVMMTLDCAMGIAIGVISWMAGGSFNMLLTQLPVFVLNIYMVIVAHSYRSQCKAWALNGGQGLPGDGAGLPPLPSAVITSGSAKSRGGSGDDGHAPGGGYSDGAAVAAGGGGVGTVALHEEEDDSDGDLGRGGAPSGVPRAHARV